MRKIFSFLDRRDDRRAREIRAELGPRGVLVSWHRVDLPHARRRWLARVSCRDWPETVEQAGFSRCRAILAATERLKGCTLPGRDPS
jgi:hypothetical protein